MLRPAIFKKDYRKKHAWQYDIRLKNLKDDIKTSGLTEKELSNLKVSDFDFDYVPADFKTKCNEIKNFIERHEWLGSMPLEFPKKN
ncbi:MAG: hypothetical protein KAQ98_14310, partial [Bacteriovoracaceae bacterium]|nr:hypothetical protein [Bacteriovoracaceae bacterium]